MSDFTIENGILKKYHGGGGDVVIPEGVTTISSFAFEYVREMTSLSLPASLEQIRDAAFSNCSALAEIRLAEGNRHFVLVDGVLYDREMKTLVLYPTGKDCPDYTVPAGVETISIITMPQQEGFHLHLTGDVQSMGYGRGGSIVIHAPSGSFAERYARRHFDNDCTFVEEGDPMSPDESAVRAERNLKQWRAYFTFTVRSDGLSISAYLRGSKTVYLPDQMGNREVVSLGTLAFPPDVAVLCSKRMFFMLQPENRHATIRTFLVDRALFTDEEQAYLLAHLKKHRSFYLEKYIKEEDYPALEACFKAMPRVKTLVEECLAITQRLGLTHINLFLLQWGQERNPALNL